MVSPVTAAATLRAAGGQPIQSWGTRTLPLSFSSSSGGTHRFDWEFTLAAVDRPILGADFLRHHQFDVEIDGVDEGEAVVDGVDDGEGEVEGVDDGEGEGEGVDGGEGEEN